MKTVYNFSAGPAVLPKKVLEKAQFELLNYKNSGMSVMELSHRSSLFQSIMQDAEKLLRELMNIPQNYKVLFLQGGASLQFTMVPLNLAKHKKALYVNTGLWSQRAITEAQKLANVTVEVVASSEADHFHHIPDIRREDISQDAAYVHMTTNNTVNGTAIYTLPDTGNVPIVADMSSNILSVNYQVADFGLIYAGAQKNIGPAGVTVVIVREDLLGHATNLSTMLDYDVHVKNNSMYNTPPTYGIYMAKLVFEWIKEQGGVAEMEKRNTEKAKMLYEVLAQSSLFTTSVNHKEGSINNIPFTTGSAALDTRFLQEATGAGFENLKGHRSVGGMRASLYNAFPKEGVVALVDFMQQFEKNIQKNK